MRLYDAGAMITDRNNQIAFVWLAQNRFDLLLRAIFLYRGNYKMSNWDKYKEAKACPFCGEISIRIFYKVKEGWVIVCDICHIEGPLGRTELSAVRKWNRRPAFIPNQETLQTIEKCEGNTRRFATVSGLMKM